MEEVKHWNWGMIGVVLAGIVILIAIYQVVESSEAELRAEMHRIEAQRQADEAALTAKLDQFIERVDSRLDEVERNQSRLDGVNDLLSRHILER